MDDDSKVTPIFPGVAVSYSADVSAHARFLAQARAHRTRQRDAFKAIGRAEAFVEMARELLSTIAGAEHPPLDPSAHEIAGAVHAAHALLIRLYEQIDPTTGRPYFENCAASSAPQSD
jgi:hypothetical protein